MCAGYPAAPHTLAPEHLPPYLCQWLALAMVPADSDVGRVVAGGACAPRLALALARHPAVESLAPPIKAPLERLEADVWAQQHAVNFTQQVTLAWTIDSRGRVLVVVAGA